MVSNLAEVILEEIFEYEELLFVDTSVRTGESFKEFNGLSFGEYIYNIREFDRLKPNYVRGEIRGIESYLSILRNPKTRTIEEVTIELERYERFLKNERKRFKSATTKTGRKNQNLLRKLIICVNEAVNLSQEREVSLESAQFNALYSLVRLIIDPLNLKEKRNKYGKIRGKLEPLETDEKLVTACFQYSMQGIKPSIITADTDFLILFGVIPRYLGAEYFQPYNNYFRESIQDFSPNVFFCEKNKIVLRDFEALKFYGLNKNNRGLTENSKNQILEMWREKEFVINGEDSVSEG